MNELLFLDIGSLVRTNSGTKHHGKMGIVTHVKYRWSDPREEELEVAVLYPETGEEMWWSEYSLEVVG
jgi:hypothetical protein